MNTPQLSKFTLLFMILFLAGCQSKIEQKEKEVHPSGAAYSLDHFTHLRTYPDGQLHNQKYQEAFQQKQIQALTESGIDSEFEALGPKNIGGRTLCIAFDPMNPFVIYVGAASGGLWKSTTMGIGENAWEPIKTNFPVLGVGAIAIAPNDPDVIYIGTGEVYNFRNAAIGNINRLTRGTYGLGILKSTDGGTTWSKSLDWELDEFTGVQDIVIDPNDPSIVFAATTEGFYRSQDAGDTWVAINNIEMIVDIEINPQNPDEIYFTHGSINGTSAGIYKSTDGGDSFTELNNGLPSTWDGRALLSINPQNPQEIYASIANAFNSIGLFKSIFGGTSWTLVNDEDIAAHQGWYSHDVAVNPSNPNELVYSGFEVYRSTNGGITLNQVGFWDLWEFGQVPVGGPEGPSDYVHADIHQVKYHPNFPNLVFALTDGGVFASSNGGQDWEGRNGGYQTQQFYANFSNSSTDSLFAIGGMQDNATAIYTGSDAWTRVLFADGMCTAIDQTDDQNVYGSFQRLGMRGSTNRGASFFNVAPFGVQDPLFNAPFALAPTDQSTIYAGSQKIHVSPDKGNSWSTSSDNVSGNNSLLTIAVSPTNKDVLFASTSDFLLSNPPTVVKSIDAGQNWIEMTGLPNRNASDIAFDPTDDQIVYITFSGFFTDHVYRSMDGGVSWSSIANGLPDVPTNTIVVDPLNPDILYVGNDLGVYCSTNGGDSWEVFSNGLPDAILVMHLSISPSNRKLRVASHGHGVYQGDLIEPAITATKDLVDIGLKNLSVFPNPVIDQSTVRFFLEERMELNLSLINADGKMNQLLFSGTKPAGAQAFNFNWESLPSGIYFYQLTAKTVDGKNRAVKTISFVR